MAVPPRVSLITLGVKDVARSTRFYQELGWPLSSASVPGEVSFFRTAGGLLAIWGRETLAGDAGVEVGSVRIDGSQAVAMNLDSRDDVDAALATAVKAGAQITREARATDWGGYNGYFTDPDGHLWEVAYNPDWPVGPDGRPALPE